MLPFHGRRSIVGLQSNSKRLCAHVAVTSSSSAASDNSSHTTTSIVSSSNFTVSNAPLAAEVSASSSSPFYPLNIHTRVANSTMLQRLRRAADFSMGTIANPVVVSRASDRSFATLCRPTSVLRNSHTLEDDLHDLFGDGEGSSKRTKNSATEEEGGGEGSSSTRTGNNLSTQRRGGYGGRGGRGGGRGGRGGGGFANRNVDASSESADGGAESSDAFGGFKGTPFNRPAKTDGGGNAFRSSSRGRGRGSGSSSRGAGGGRGRGGSGGGRGRGSGKKDPMTEVVYIDSKEIIDHLTSPARHIKTDIIDPNLLDFDSWGAAVWKEGVDPVTATRLAESAARRANPNADGESAASTTFTGDESVSPSLLGGGFSSSLTATLTNTPSSIIHDSLAKMIRGEVDGMRGFLRKGNLNRDEVVLTAEHRLVGAILIQWPTVKNGSRHWARIQVTEAFLEKKLKEQLRYQLSQRGGTAKFCASQHTFFGTRTEWGKPVIYLKPISCNLLQERHYKTKQEAIKAEEDKIATEAASFWRRDHDSQATTASASRFTVPSNADGEATSRGDDATEDGGERFGRGAGRGRGGAGGDRKHRGAFKGADSNYKSKGSQSSYLSSEVIDQSYTTVAVPATINPIAECVASAFAAVKQTTPTSVIRHAASVAYLKEADVEAAVGQLAPKDVMDRLVVELGLEAPEDAVSSSSSSSRSLAKPRNTSASNGSINRNSNNRRSSSSAPSSSSSSSTPSSFDIADVDTWGDPTSTDGSWHASLIDVMDGLAERGFGHDCEDSNYKRIIYAWGKYDALMSRLVIQSALKALGV